MLDPDPDPDPGTHPRASHYCSSPRRVALFPRWSHVVQGAFSGFCPSAASLAARCCLRSAPRQASVCSSRLCDQDLGVRIVEKGEKPREARREDSTAELRPPSSVSGSAPWEGSEQVGTWRISHALFLMSGSPGDSTFMCSHVLVLVLVVGRVYRAGENVS